MAEVDDRPADLDRERDLGKGSCFAEERNERVRDVGVYVVASVAQVRWNGVFGVGRAVVGENADRMSAGGARAERRRAHDAAAAPAQHHAASTGDGSSDLERLREDGRILRHVSRTAADNAYDRSAHDESRRWG